MADKTNISWTRGDDGSQGSTWNPIRGCTPVSPGCKNCYAAKVAKRFSFPGGPFQGLVRINAAGERTDEWNGEITYVEDHLLDPIRWKTPRRIFVNSVSDLFHHNVSDTVIDRIFAVMAMAPQHTFQVLTKRPERMRDYMIQTCTEEGGLRIGRSAADLMSAEGKPLSLHEQAKVSDQFEWKELFHVWLGTSVENQKYADERIPFLLQTPAAVRFISAEPLLGPIDLTRIVIHEALGRIPAVSFDSLLGWNGGAKRPYRCGLDWVIVGGESQRGSRPMDPRWARSLRDQCKAVGVPFFYKQTGDWVTREVACNIIGDDAVRSAKKGTYTVMGQEFYHRLGTKKTGDFLDGVQWHEYPRVEK